MYRGAFIAQIQNAKTDLTRAWLEEHKQQLTEMLKNDQFITLSVFSWNNYLFLYYECVDAFIDPHELFTNSEHLLKTWPGIENDRLWAPMMDIFHYNSPANAVQWRRKTPVERHIGKIARLKPEMISSYIYYHYQYQEEIPGDGDKYGIINLHENLMFFYLEDPAVIEPSPFKGKLDTELRPPNWGEVMQPHFILWEDAPQGQEIWRDTVLIFAL